MTKSITKKAIEMGKKFLNDSEAQIGGVGTLYAVFFAAIVVLAIIIIFTFIPGIGSTIEQSTPIAPAYGQPGGDWNSSAVGAAVKASGTMNATGNFTDGDLVTVAGVIFEINLTGTPACSVQNACVNGTDSAGVPANVIPALEVKINGNATASALVDALNIDATHMSVTAVLAGDAGNSIGTSDDATNTTWTSTTLIGGSDSGLANPNAAALRGSSGAAIWTSTSGMLKVAMIIGIVVIILGSLFAIFAARRQAGGGNGGGM